MCETSELDQQIRNVRHRLIERDVATAATIVGCTESEVAAIEADVGQPLPTAYREFLRQMGRGAGRFYLGSDLFYPRLLGLTQQARELVALEEPELRLPADAIAICIHQGYQCLFIHANRNADPAVYYYLEQSGTFELKSDQLTKFLFAVAGDEW